MDGDARLQGPVLRPNRRPSSPQCRGNKLYLFWHEYILIPLYLRGHCNLSMLLSRHRDAEILSHIAYHLGYDFVRGSTNRGGVAALRELLAKSRQMHLTITPDGPRGPRRRMAPGPIYLASKLGMPLVLMGYGSDRPWRLRSWDRFAVPRPFSARGPSPPVKSTFRPTWTVPGWSIFAWKWKSNSTASPRRPRRGPSLAAARPVNRLCAAARHRWGKQPILAASAAAAGRHKDF